MRNLKKLTAGLLSAAILFLPTTCGSGSAAVPDSGNTTPQPAAPAAPAAGAKAASAFSWSYTRLDWLDGDLSSLRTGLGNGDVALTCSLVQ